MRLGPGDTLGPYKIVEEIGEGGMARVFQVTGPGGVELAVKVLRDELSDRDEVLQRFLREAHILSKLDHPHIVKVLEVGPEIRPAWFAMEWVRGPSLSAALKPGKPMGDGEALAVMADILAALDHAHAAGIVHRDLKPANVLLTEEGRAKLSDFGIAKMLEGTQLTATGARLGTPHYMAPEQVRGRRSVGVGADIYSAGILLYELLTGRRPFDGQDPVAIGYCHAYEEPPPLKRRGKGVPQGVAAVVLKALEKKVGSRYRSARTMRRALAPAAKKLDRPFPPLSRAPRPKAKAKARAAHRTPTPAGAMPVAMPAPRHIGQAGGTRRLLLGLASMVGASLILGVLPGGPPGIQARSPGAARLGRRLFLQGLGAASSGHWRDAVPAWKRAAEADPSLLPAVRDHAVQALADSLQRSQRDAARAYLQVARWADPGWVGGLDYEQRLRRRWPD